MTCRSHFRPSRAHSLMQGPSSGWMSRYKSARVKTEGAKKVCKNCKHWQLCLENRCHTYVCRLFQVIKHISAGV